MRQYCHPAWPRSGDNTQTPKGTRDGDRGAGNLEGEKSEKDQNPESLTDSGEAGSNLSEELSCAVHSPNH